MAELLTLRKFEALSPFEIKNELIGARQGELQDGPIGLPECRPGQSQLDRNEPREGFFLLGQRDHREQARDGPGAGDRRNAAGQGHRLRLDAWLAKHADMPGAAFSSMVPFAINTFAFEPDAFVHELVDSIIGDNYPVPDRMLVHNERIVHEYLMWAMCGQPHPTGKFDLYAVEGGTAAMCYIFKSLKANRLLFPGDTIALGTPIFTPYLEMTHLEDYDLKVVNIAAPQENRFQYTDEESRSWKTRR